MEKELNLLGHKVNISPDKNGKKTPSGVPNKAVIEKAIQTLKEYKDGKSNLEKRIIEEDKWWKLRQWEEFASSRDKNNKRAQPVSAWLFNSVINKHADAMDNYPEPNVLPRERGDEEDAKILSSILPVIIERNKFEQTYSDAWWYKLKHGSCAYGVFWNNKLENGLGDVDIKCIDLLNIFWEPGIKNIQDSRNLFVVNLVDNEILEANYPKLKNKAKGNAIEVEQYVYDDAVDVSNKTAVVDWYYKTTDLTGKTILNYCKFAGSEVLFYSEGAPDYEGGFYEHGQYPVIFDTLYPDEGTPAGFGLIAIMKNPQMYIDKLNQVILENTVMASQPRFFISGASGINEDEFLDWSKPLVHVEGSLDENRLRQINTQIVSGHTLNFLQMKIDELKETSSNRDVSQGGTSSGATAAAAIVALQEAGNKTSRDMIHSAYRAFTEINYLIIELIRQFYDETRHFRITGENGAVQFVEFNNANLKQETTLETYPGERFEEGYTPGERKPVFDIVIKPQKRSAYSKLSQNELAKELYNLGFFNPELAPQSLAAIDMMDFDGIEKVKAKIQEGNTLHEQILQMQEQMTKMAQALSVVTGRNSMGAPTWQSQNPRVPREASSQTSDGSGYLNNLIKNSQMDITPEDKGDNQI